MIYRAKVVEIITENGDKLSVPADDGELEKLAEVFNKNTEKQIELIRELGKKTDEN